MAVLITFGFIRATQMNERERQHRFELAQQARLAALDRLEVELQEREIIRKELLRHTVQTQEEERARISRELHDETSQTLTAFTFHLAALRNLSPNDAHLRG